MSNIPECFKNYDLEECVMPAAAPGKNAVAELQLVSSGNKTFLSKNYTAAPARVLHALYYDEFRPGMPYVIFVNPTSGIIEGDRYRYSISLGKNAEAFITDSTASKIHRMDSNCGIRFTDIQLGESSRLEYIPKENIAFAGSRWHQELSFSLKKGASLFYSEIFCPGRTARGESWDFDAYSSRLTVTKNQKLILMDNVLWTSEDKEFSEMLFGGCKYLLSAYLISDSASGIRIRTEGLMGVSEAPYSSGLIIKALSDSMDDLKDLQITLWDAFRREETGSPAPDLRMQYGRCRQHGA